MKLKTRSGPAGISDAASDGEDMRPGTVGQMLLTFETVMDDFEKNIAILRKNFYKEEYLK